MSNAGIKQKIVFQGTLQLDSPLLIGSGTELDKEKHKEKHKVDIHVLKDKWETPFIPGSSLAGVLRAWLASQNPNAADNLFGCMNNGGSQNDTLDIQSSISVSDVVLDIGDAEVIVRDGVSIDSLTGIGISGAKYDYEVVERGAKGLFLMVMTVREFQEKNIPDLDRLIKLLADRLCTGIRLGAMTSKGLGMISVPNVNVYRYNFKNKESVVNWLLKKPVSSWYCGTKIKKETATTFIVDGEFALRTSLLIRDQDVYETINDIRLAAKPMKSGDDYLIPGTSLKGVFRHQAEKILTILNKPVVWLDELMGYSKDSENQKKSRFIINEAFFKEGITEYGQVRNKIDRFTGGVIESNIFANLALWQKEHEKPVLHIHYEILECKEWEAGLALFLLKDLWTGKIALGGEKSIGRGLLKGISASVTFKGERYDIGENGKVDEKTKNALESFAEALKLKDKEAKTV